MPREGVPDRACGQAGVQECVDDGEHAEDGEGDADVGYYVCCVCHLCFFFWLFWLFGGGFMYCMNR